MTHPDAIIAVRDAALPRRFRAVRAAGPVHAALGPARLHAARQVGRTTSYRALARELTAGGKHIAVHASCEEGQAARSAVERGVPAVVDALQRASWQQLPAETGPLDTRLGDSPSRWAARAPRGVVVFFDEIDALHDDVLIAVLRQLRAGYPARPQRFPHSVVLIGMRDVRDYRVAAGVLGTASPFNVNALAREAVERLMPDQRQPITVATIDAAKEALIVRPDRAAARAARAPVI